MQVYCNNCGSICEPGAHFCMTCGAPLPAPKICPNCGGSLDAQDAFCMYCGAKVPIENFEDLNPDKNETTAQHPVSHPISAMEQNTAACSSEHTGPTVAQATTQAQGPRIDYIQARDYFNGIKKERPAQAPVQAPVQRPVQEPVQRPAQEPVQRPAQRPAQEPVQRPEQRPAQRPAQEPVQRPAQRPAQEPVQRPVQRPAQEPVQRPEQRPAQRPAQEPMQRPEQKLCEEQPSPSLSSKIPTDEQPRHEEAVIEEEKVGEKQSFEEVRSRESNAKSQNHDAYDESLGANEAFIEENDCTPSGTKKMGPLAFLSKWRREKASKSEDKEFAEDGEEAPEDKSDQRTRKFQEVANADGYYNDKRPSDYDEHEELRGLDKAQLLRTALTVAGIVIGACLLIFIQGKFS